VKRTLSLHRETLADLTPAELTAVVGAQAATQVLDNTCHGCATTIDIIYTCVWCLTEMCG
jgi:hypothetical protein